MNRIYYGWYVVAMALIISAALVGATAAAFSVFFLPVAADLKLSRAGMNTALIFQHIGNAVFSPFIGRLLDKVPTKPVMIACAVVFTVSYIILGLSHALWLDAVVIAVGIPIAYLGAGSLTNTVLIARWFKLQRGRAMQLGGLGLYVGTMIAPPFIALLIQGYGWRPALMVIAVTVGALLLAIALIIRVRPGPNDIEVAPGGTRAGIPAEQTAGLPMKVPVLLRMPVFWMLAVSGAIAVSVNQGVFVTLVPLGRDNGLSLMQSTALPSALGGAALIGGLLFSIVADKVDRVFFLTGTFVLIALVNLAVLADRSYATLLIAAIVLGACSSTMLNCYYALLADRFGAPSFGTVRGTVFMLFGIIGMITVRFSGEVYDRTGNYNLMFVTFALVQVFAGVLMFATRFSGRRAPVPTMAAQ